MASRDSQRRCLSLQPFGGIKLSLASGPKATSEEIWYKRFVHVDPNGLAEREPDGMQVGDPQQEQMNMEFE